MISLCPLIIIQLLIHWIADFYFQTDKMAINKSTSMKWLTYHVLTYTGIFIILNNYIILSNISILFWILFNGASHWIIDFFTSKITSYFWKKEDRHNFFVTIGFDQFLHVSILIITIPLFVKINY